MTSKQTTKTLLSSAISLVLCCAMLLGTTMAWFTATVESNGHQIYIGILDIDLLNEEGSLKDTTKTIKLFDSVKRWEANATAVEQFTVADKGDLAFKYQMTLSAGEANTAISDEFEVWVYDGKWDTANNSYDKIVADANWEKVGSLTDVLNGKQLFNGMMNIDKDHVDTQNPTHTYTVALHLPKEATGKGIMGKKLVINAKLEATQLTAETDTFGPDYDKPTVWMGGMLQPQIKDGAYQIGCGEELAWYSAYMNGTLPATYAAESTKSAVLTKDIDLNNIPFTPISTLPKTATFDGQGYTISNLYMVGGKNVALFGNPIGLIKNVKLKNVYAEGAKYVGGIAGYLCENVGIENCHVENATIISNPVATNGVYDDGQHAGALVGYADSTHIINCSAKNVAVSAYRDLGGLVGTATHSSAKPLTEIKGCSGSGITLAYISVDNYNGKDNSNMGNLFGRGEADVDDYTRANVEDAVLVTPIAKGLSKDNQKNVYVSSGEGLANLNTWLADKSENKQYTKIILTANIDFEGYTWTPVDSHADSNVFISGIDGRGHTISNLTVNGQAMFTRFAGFGDVVIKDVTFDNATVTSTGINTSILTVQTYQNTLLDNVDVKNSYIEGTYKVAPLMGTVYNESTSAITATLKDCDVSNTVVKAVSYDFCTTGMVAFVYEGNNDKIEFENCTVSDVTLVVPYDDYKAHGFVYSIDGSPEYCYDTAEGVTVTDCSVNSYLDGTTTFAGGTLYLLDGTYVTAAEGKNALTITGDTTLIVEGEATLGGGKNGSGIYVAEGVKLTVTGDGDLTVYGNSGIEYEASGNYSEYPTATSFDGTGGSGINATNATVIIDGLKNITAEGYGKNGFGIGGNGANVTVKNSTVDYVRGGFLNLTGEYNDAKWTKSEPEGGAAIGGAAIVIENTQIKKAEGGSKAAGIGARYHEATNVTIKNSTIDSVVGGVSAAGIGGSRISDAISGDNQAVSVTIEDSTITAQGGYYGAGIGGGYDTHCSKPADSWFPITTINIKGSSVINATGGTYAAGIGTGYHAGGLKGEIETTVAVTAASGEKFYKDTYTKAQDVGFGVIDPTRDGLNNTCTFKYQGVEFGVPAV